MSYREPAVLAHEGFELVGREASVAVPAVGGPLDVPVAVATRHHLEHPSEGGSIGELVGLGDVEVAVPGHATNVAREGSATEHGQESEGSLNRKPLVYLAGPYASHPTHNTRTAILEGMALWRTGLVAVLIPHTSMLADVVAPMDEADWYAFDLDQLEHCDALLRLPGDSKGADTEVTFAEARDIPVFHTPAELLAWAQDRVEVAPA